MFSGTERGYLDQAWVDLFFRYISKQPRGGTIPEILDPGLPQNASISEVCPPLWPEEPREVREVPVETMPGAKTLDINVCLLNPSNNFLVSFNGLNTCSDEVLEFCLSGLAVAECVAKPGIRVLHWPGGVWKPWRHTHLLGQSVADELWWFAFKEARKVRCCPFFSISKAS